MKMFDAFENVLAMGLGRGQVLRCDLATAQASNMERPYLGPWIVETTDGNRRELPTPLRAAKMWRMYLHMQTQLNATTPAFPWPDDSEPAANRNTLPESSGLESVGVKDDCVV
jgi:hypothetical protein